MKTAQLFIPVIAIAALTAGCNKSNPTIEGSPANGTNVSSVSQKLEEAKEIATNALTSAKDSVQSFADFAFGKKDDCVAQAGAELDSLDQKIKELSDKAATASDSVKAEAQTKLRMVSDQRAALNQKLAALQTATAANWDDAKMDFKKAYDEAKTSCQQAWQWLAEKLGS